MRGTDAKRGDEGLLELRPRGPAAEQVSGSGPKHEKRGKI